MSKEPAGLVIAATSSHSGKTTLTLGLARALKNFGYSVGCAKSGPDYIDPTYLEAATGYPCPNLDGWAMSDDRMKSLLPDAGIVLVEGAMGLFDGAPPRGRGSTADVAKRLNLPVVLVIDCASLSHSVAAIAAGFVHHDPDLTIGGVILNQVGTPRHEAMLRTAIEPLNIPILGCIRRIPELVRPSRHLGLHMAHEDKELDAFLNNAARQIASFIDVEALASLATRCPEPVNPLGLKPLGERISIAKDAAFTFTYAHMLNDWTKQGAKLSYFSPLANEAPAEGSDAVFLPGGYPELHAQDLARAGNFRAKMKEIAASGTHIYGECGGYMVLGHRLTNGRNIPFPMLGLLDLHTSFATRKLQLGYRKLTATQGPMAGEYKGHEFHYSSVLEERGTPLFKSENASGEEIGNKGLVSGNVSGSFAHIIDRA